MSLDKFKEVMQKYTNLDLKIRKNVNSYDDPVRKFILEAFSTVPYFEDLSSDDKNNVQFNFKPKNFSNDSLIIEKGHISNNLTIIFKGIVEVYTKATSQTTG